MFDLGYLGVEKDLPERLISSIPNRKQRNLLQLFKEQKEYNLQHAICRLKKYRIFAEVFRNKLKK